MSSVFKQRVSPRIHSIIFMWCGESACGVVRRICLRKARPLLRKLKENSDIQWDVNGNFNIYGNSIPGANIVDLISDFVRSRIINIPPTGWEPFAVLLANPIYP